MNILRPFQFGIMEVAVMQAAGEDNLIHMGLNGARFGYWGQSPQLSADFPQLFAHITPKNGADSAFSRSI
ncbi:MULTISPECIES: hypothetical protein [Sphingobium]|uniref:Uncharacterized protein n=1 Tax=Sphingobium chungbukense TaxID=56193 RepID=A0A0M3AK84_9SPHN|nr:MULTISPECIES: hypothetical protein [Sphingobium]KKW89361.1 hypothetical protein YP76_25920 [Sphingobium chungbukense]MCB4859011.1 hypothetical protein [Sphingobium sp. PNB]MEC6701534.1 hypothetical protein [Sphingobium sp. SJ10-10]NML91602.1 hypothetical protein [Sphingobium sp. TB-6]